MWFGTEAGLAKFDGRRTQTVNDPSLPTGRVLALQSDLDGALWIGTDGGAAECLQESLKQSKKLAGKLSLPSLRLNLAAHSWPQNKGRCLNVAPSFQQQQFN